jgi:DNA-binding MarR family transcriptional regulator
VQRERSREDRRAVQLRLTDAGLATIAALLPKVVDKLNFTLRDFTRAEATELNRLLSKLITSLESPSVEPGAAA